uniref:Uncharacterized protein n=1 Tax=Anisakis simplex TaxID=6269 RepID=A0A0M3IZ61_ANISI
LRLRVVMLVVFHFVTDGCFVWVPLIHSRCSDFSD